jgi:hypothetical protein
MESVVPVTAERAPISAELAPARLGYLVPWGSAAAAAVQEALAEGLRARSAGEPLTIAGRRYGIGATLFRVADNGAELAPRLGEIAARHGIEVVAVDSGWVDEGISLGSSRMRPLRAPRVLLAWDEPTRSLSAGWARYVLERRFGISVTAVRTASLAYVDLTRYDALVLPSGSYSDAFGEGALRRLRGWIGDGGTLVTLGEASRWAAEGRAGLLATTTELKGGAPETPGEDEDEPRGERRGAGEGEPFDYEEAIRPDRERPDSTPGTLMRVELELSHWLAAGSDGEVQALVSGRRVFTPIRLDEGRNVGIYAERERLVAGGLIWPDTAEQLPRKAFLMHQPIGDGHLVAFAEDPNYRGYAEGTELLFANALMFGPAF